MGLIILSVIVSIVMGGLYFFVRFSPEGRQAWGDKPKPPKSNKVLVVEKKFNNYIGRFLKNKVNVAIGLSIIAVIGVVIGIAVERSKYEDKFSLVFATKISDVDFIDLRNDWRFKNDLLDRIKSTNDPYEIVTCVGNLNKYAYHWDDKDERVKNAIVSQIKKIVNSQNSIDQELKLYADLENAYFVSDPIYGNINDIITQNELENKIKSLMSETEIGDWSIETNNYNHAYVGGEIGDLDISLVTITKYKLYYQGEQVKMTYADSEEQSEFCRALRALASDKSQNGKIYYYFGTSTAAVFDHGEDAYSSTTIYTSYGDIRFSLGE